MSVFIEVAKLVLGGFVRQALVFLSAWLIARGVLTPDQDFNGNAALAGEIVGWLILAATVAWTAITLIDVDPQLLTSAVMNLLHNAFKYTRDGGAVVLRAHAHGDRLLVEIEDQCGGIPDTKSDLFQPFGERRGRDRSGLGLGLSIARQAVRAHDGDIHVRNIPGQGCIFTIDLPLATDIAGAAQEPDGRLLRRMEGES